MISGGLGLSQVSNLIRDPGVADATQKSHNGLRTEPDPTPLL